MSSLGASSFPSATLVVAGPSGAKGRDRNLVGRVGVGSEICGAVGLNSACAGDFAGGFIGVQKED